MPLAAPPSPPSRPVVPPASSTLSRMIRGTFWLALRTPVSVVIALWSVPLTQEYIGYKNNGAYLFAWGFGFIQFLLEFGMSSALQTADLRRLDPGRPRRGGPGDRLRDELLRGRGPGADRGAAGDRLRRRARPKFRGRVVG